MVVENKGISLDEIKKKYSLKEITNNKHLADIVVKVSQITRPALCFTGFFEKFSHDRVQIIGKQECAYLATLDEKTYRKNCEDFLAYRPPCIIFCSGEEPDDVFIKLAEKYEVPIFVTEYLTSTVVSELTRFLNVKLAPIEIIHGVLVEVGGVGVLITGESGIGKSEAALELLRRGHRLVSDDTVEIHRLNSDTLIGYSPDITQNMIEVRGIGIIDVKALFGVQCVKNGKKISLVVNLEEWNKDKNYNRDGMETHYKEILNNKIEMHNIPVRPGRNLAVIVETAAIDYRQRKMGYNAGEELFNRVNKKMMEGK